MNEEVTRKNKKLALIGGTLIDGSGKEPIKNVTVLIDGPVIEEIEGKNSIKLPEVCEVIDVTGKTIMPGMMDLHVHLSLDASDVLRWQWGVGAALDIPLTMFGLKAFARARRTLAMGFTTLRDVGDFADQAISLRNAINSKIVEGPRILASGPYLSTTSGAANYLPPWLYRTDIIGNVADGVDGVLKFVRRQIKMGVDWVKFVATGGGTMNTWDKQQFNDDEIRTIIGEAHRKGRLVCAHCIQSQGTLASVREGVDTVEHGSELTEEIIDLMLKKETFLVPTLYVMVAVVDRGTEFGFPMDAIETCRPILDRHLRSFQMALKAGVKIAFGTDAGYPSVHGTNAYELELMVKYGMTPMDAIVAATKTSACALRLDDRLGTIEKGKLADIIVVDGDPLKDIRILQDEKKIRLVMKEGIVYVNRVGQ